MYRPIIAVLTILVPAGADAQGWKECGTFKGCDLVIGRSALSPDGKLLATSHRNSTGVELKVWDTASGKAIATLPGCAEQLYSLSFSGDGKRLAAGCLEETQIWDLRSRTSVGSIPSKDYPPYVIALNRDGSKVAVLGDRDVKIREVASGKELSSFRQRIACYGRLGAAFKDDLTTLAAGNYQEIDLWDVAKGKEKRILSEHRGEVGCMAWCADGRTLIASSSRYEGKGFEYKGDVKLWDSTTGKGRAVPGPFGLVSLMARSPDGKTLALLDEARLRDECVVKLVNLAGGRRRILRSPPGSVLGALRFTPEGKLVVVGWSGDALRVWEVSLAGGAKR